MWASPDDLRTPFAWLRARCIDSDRLIGIYQDDAAFGLNFANELDRRLPDADESQLRSRRGIPLADGRINAVEVVFDTTEGAAGSGVVTEALLHGENVTTLLVAAEAYSREEWHLYDESIVALTDTTAADQLEWIPPRHAWRPTQRRRPGPQG